MFCLRKSVQLSGSELIYRQKYWLSGGRLTEQGFGAAGSERTGGQWLDGFQPAGGGVVWW